MEGVWRSFEVGFSPTMISGGSMRPATTKIKVACIPGPPCDMSWNISGISLKLKGDPGSAPGMRPGFLPALVWHFQSPPGSLKNM